MASKRGWIGSAAFGVTVVALACAGVAPPARAQQSANHSQWAFPGGDGRLQYKADAEGNTVPDFSNAGYGGGGVRIPDVVVKATVEPKDGEQDAGKRIQAAVDEVSNMPPGADGFRGAVLIKRGTYRVPGTIVIGASGVVLRGEGDGEDGTVLIAAGTKPRDLIEIKGKAAERPGKGVEITDEYVPVGARTFTVADGSGLKAGDAVIVSRVGNKAWIHFIKMDQITPRPTKNGEDSGTKQWEPFNLAFDRVVTKVEGNKVTVDAPIVCAIEKKWGGGTVAKYEDKGRIEHCGVENLRGVSEFDPSVKKEEKGKEYSADEQHATYLVGLANVKNAWARNVTARYFYNGVSNCEGGAKWVTVQDSTSIDPVSVITGGRRYPFAIQGAQLVLVQRCRSDEDRHAFVVGSRVCGPNVFLDCVSTNAHATSEPHHRWSVGGLYDNVHAQMAIQDRQWMGSGHGWAGANYVVWNSEGSLVCQRPPTANNWAIGFVGKREKGAFEGKQEGTWDSYGKHVEPRSLYLKQLEDRLGKAAVANISK